LEHDARVTTSLDDAYKDNRAFLTVGYRPNSRPPTPDPGE
jgi:hypothetical protein